MLPAWRAEAHPVPSATSRVGHCTVVVGDQIVVFGGRAQPPADHFEIPYINGNVTNEVWSRHTGADPAQSPWVLRRADEGDPVVVTTRYVSDSIPDYYLRTTPLKREKHACVAHGTNLYVWGGKSFWWYPAGRVPSGTSPRQFLDLNDLWQLVCSALVLHVNSPTGSWPRVVQSEQYLSNLTMKDY